MDAIWIEGLEKGRSDEATPGEGLTMTIQEGELFGLIGPEGSGKTVLVRMLNGLVAPSAGMCRVMGINPVEGAQKLHALCGAASGKSAMYGHMNALQNLLFFGQLYGLSVSEARQRASELLKDFEIWEEREKPVKRYSLAEMTRLLLARALLHRPKVLLLDDPARLLEPGPAHSLAQQVVAIARREGIAVLFCSRRAQDVQGLCDRYGFLKKGRLAVCGDVETLSGKLGCSLTAGFRFLNGHVPQGLTQTDEWWNLKIERETEMPGLLRKFLEEGAEILEARITRPTLEDVYQKYLAREKLVEEK